MVIGKDKTYRKYLNLLDSDSRKIRQVVDSVEDKKSEKNH